MYPIVYVSSSSVEDPRQEVFQLRGRMRFFGQAYVLQMASRNEERTADAVALDLEDWQPVDSPMFVPFLCPCQAC